MSYVISEEEKKSDNLTVCVDYWIIFESPEPIPDSAAAH